MHNQLSLKSCKVETSVIKLGLQKDLIKADKDVVAPFLMTYETFSHARRVCPIGMHRVINDSNSFPHLVTQKGKIL